MTENIKKLIRELEYAKKNFQTVVIPRGKVEPILKEIKDFQQYKQAFGASRSAGVKISLDRPLNKALLRGMRHEW